VADSRLPSVDVTGLQRLADEFDHGEGTPLERVSAFTTRYPSELAKVRRQTYRAAGARAKLLPVAVNGSPRRGLDQVYFWTPLRHGTLGYLQRRSDDCLQVSLASLVQMPPHLVPDLNINQRLLAVQDLDKVFAESDEKMLRWTGEQGVRTVRHAKPLPSAHRWIGVIPAHFGLSHCLLMSGHDCIFDPANAAVPPDVERSQYDPADIDYSITIEGN
jgi:hypothetical protein